MEIPISRELKEICVEVQETGYSLEQWAEIESDDMFQNGSYCGGFDADEGEFCFSFYSSSGQELWFQIDLDLAYRIANGSPLSILGRLADK